MSKLTDELKKFLDEVRTDNDRELEGKKAQQREKEGREEICRRLYLPVLHEAAQFLKGEGYPAAHAAVEPNENDEPSAVLHLGSDVSIRYTPGATPPREFFRSNKRMMSPNDRAVKLPQEPDAFGQQLVLDLRDLRSLLRR